MPGTQKAKQIWTIIAKAKAFDSVMKTAEVISAGNGRCVCKMKVGEEHLNLGGTLHGGMTATIVDMVSTVALVTTEPHVPGVSVDLSVSYLRAANPGEEITIDAKASKIGRTLSFLTVDLTDSKGKLIAQGKHTKFIAGDDK